MPHTFDPANADRLDDVSRYRYCSRDELVRLIDPSPETLTLDLGSGTGFYTTDVAPHTGSVVGIDVQPAMQAIFQDHGVPANTQLVTAEIDQMPLQTGMIDVAFSTMTFHEFATPSALLEVGRVLRSDGRFVTVDWSANGVGDAGPPREDCVTAGEAEEMVADAGFNVVRAEERVETFTVLAMN